MVYSFSLRGSTFKAVGGRNPQTIAGRAGGHSEKLADEHFHCLLLVVPGKNKKRLDEIIRFCRSKYCHAKGAFIEIMSSDVRESSPADGDPRFPAGWARNFRMSPVGHKRR